MSDTPPRGPAATRSELDAMLRARYGTVTAERVSPWVLPGIGFDDGALGEEPVALGTCRFGGRPDLPDGVAWPVGPDGPLAFLGQVGLGEVAPLDVDRVLPPAGTLVFFYNIADYAWGSRPEDRDRFAVVFTPAGATLARRPFPPDTRKENRVARVRHVQPFLQWDVALYDPLAREQLGTDWLPTGTDPELDPLHEWLDQLSWELRDPVRGGSHQLLGWANSFFEQHDDCRLTAARSDLGFPPERTPAAAVARADRGQWRCLLEVDSDPDLYNDAHWADAGSVAFLVRDDALRAFDFGRCWCVLSSS